MVLRDRITRVFEDCENRGRRDAGTFCDGERATESDFYIFVPVI